MTKLKKSSPDAPETTPTNGTGPHEAALEQLIRNRAYEFYEQRGREDGYAEEDWLRAEAETLARRSQEKARSGPQK